MKKIVVMLVAGAAAALFAETTLDWVFDGYAESEPQATAVQATAQSVDTVAFVDCASAEVDITTERSGLVMVLR